MKEERITIYYINFIDNTEEFITDDENKANEYFENSDKNKIAQFFSKDWILENGEYQEDYVEIFYNNDKA